MDPTYLETTYSFVRLTDTPLDASSHFNDIDSSYIQYKGQKSCSPFYDGQIITVGNSDTGGGAYIYQSYTTNEENIVNVDKIITNSYYNEILSPIIKQEIIDNKSAIYSVRGTSPWKNLNNERLIDVPTSALANSNVGDVWLITEDFEYPKDSGDNYQAGTSIICEKSVMGEPDPDKRFKVLGNILNLTDYYTKSESDNNFYSYNDGHSLANTVNAHGEDINDIQNILSQIPIPIILSLSEYEALDHPDETKIYFIYEDEES